MKQNPLKKETLPVGFGKILLAHLIPDAKNPRKNLKKGDPEFEKITKSVERFGQLDPIIFNTRTRKVIGGHQRLKVLDAKGYTELYTVRLGAYTWAFAESDLKELTDKEESAANIALNKAQGDWDLDQLVINLQDLKLDGLLDVTGFDDKEFAALERDFHKDDEPLDTEPQISRAEELRKEWGTELGQIWQCGEHRVICGDCTDSAVVGRVMQGEKAVIAVTSPPYAEQRKSHYGGVNADKYVEWWEGVQASVRAILYDEGCFFVNIKEHCEDGERHLYVSDLLTTMKRKWGWRFVDELIWFKPGIPGGWDNRFRDRFERIFHFSLSKKMKFNPLEVGNQSDKTFSYSSENKLADVGDNVQLFEAAKGEKKGIARPGNVIELGANQEHLGQAAMFPVGLPSFFIKAYSDARDIVFEPFLGSGTTMIACENLGRKCRGCEIDPGYVAVILQRYKDTFPGKEIRLIADNSGA